MIVARILIIDDDPDIRALIRTILEEAEHVVFLASNGLTGIAICQELELDLVVSDVFMPKMDGLEVMCAIDRQFPGTPLLMTSAGGRGLNPGYVLDLARQFGRCQVIAKPFDRNELLRAIEGVLGSGKRMSGNPSVKLRRGAACAAMPRST